MAKDTNDAITIDDVDYRFDDMTDKQKLIVQHIADLDRKLASARFNVDQLQVGRDAFISILKNELGNRDIPA